MMRRRQGGDENEIRRLKGYKEEMREEKKWRRKENHGYIYDA